jgi:hypothetical protein
MSHLPDEVLIDDEEISIEEAKANNDIINMFQESGPTMRKNKKVLKLIVLTPRSKKKTNTTYTH